MADTKTTAPPTDREVIERQRARIIMLENLLRDSPTRGAIHDDNYWRWRRKVEAELGIG